MDSFVPRNRLTRVMRDSAKALADLVCPPECLFCRRLLSSDRMFCQDCHERLVSSYHHCLRCAAPVPPVVPNADCIKCRKANWRFDRVLALGPYRGRLREAIIRMKQPHETLLRRGIAALMAGKLDSVVMSHAGSQELCQHTVVTSVPNHWTHAMLGAADTAGELAAEIAKRTGFPLMTGMIRRTRNTSKQGMLSWSERTKNVHDAFQIRDPDKLKERHVMLVDDVLTSGATAAEIARRLKKHQVAAVTVLVAARGTGTREANTSLADP